MNLDELSVKAVYHDNAQVFDCKRKDFLTEISKRFGVNENEILIFESSKNSRRQISVDSLKPVSKVEIMQRTSPPRFLNGQRPSLSNKKTEVELCIISKLRENRALNGTERKFLIELIENDVEKSSKQNLMTEKRDKNVTVCNKKVQVSSPTLTTDAITQTESVEPKELTGANHSKKRKNDQVELQIKRIARNGNLDRAEVTRLLAESYDNRRHFILHDLPLVQHVKEKYPLLFTFEEVKNELERICHHGVCDDFLKNIEKYAETVLHSVPSTDPLLMKTFRKLERCTTEIQKNYARNVGSILLLSNFAKEERKYIRLLDKDIDPGDFPHIDARTSKMSELFHDSVVFKIVVEGNLLCEAFTFGEAILCLVAAFYIFNISYPDENFNTYVLFEKLYLESNETIDIDDCLQQSLKFLKLKCESLAKKS
ncbi:uncharacterized protein LOC118195292 isoform X2 [Stegodyphus dumicola]|uniref:uncharacterized protein LOC118195292 isoform X2 n=1 Tax=Stegodyphus dumicola TaxID=202533 RepID=UPI0015A96309|nr:uncharacterized protein LOC118195292 isoform X2 [Stegodyphus dumicola]